MRFLSRLDLLLLLVLSLLGGCASISTPSRTQTVVFHERATPPLFAFELPVDLQPVRLDARTWTVETPIVSSAHAAGFDDAVVSWNIALRDSSAAASIDVSVRRNGIWSPPLRIGHLGTAALLDPPLRRLSGNDSIALAQIDTDYFRAQEPCDAARIIVTIVSPDPGASTPPASIERLSICLSSVQHRSTHSARSLVGVAGSHRVTNAVPFRSQKTPDPALAGRLCSPTSLSMVLAFHGFDLSTASVAAAVHDPDFDLFGNWPRNVQGAYQLSGGSVGGFITRFSEWSSVAQHLDRGEPIIASIRAPRGVIRSAPYTELDGGHLIVLTGLDGRGGVYVNDPAVATPDLGQRVYSMHDLSRAWLDMGNGLAYILKRRDE